jgi:hypothetical protein
MSQNVQTQDHALDQLSSKHLQLLEQTKVKAANCGICDVFMTRGIFIGDTPCPELVYFEGSGPIETAASTPEGAIIHTIEFEYRNITNQSLD